MSTTERLAACACYVKKLSREQQFMLRWGAHEPTCPAYRESADPVDQFKDNLARARLRGKR